VTVKKVRDGDDDCAQERMESSEVLYQIRMNRPMRASAATGANDARAGILK
jgi:hypothetical protein